MVVRSMRAKTKLTSGPDDQAEVQRKSEQVVGNQGLCDSSDRDKSLADQEWDTERAVLDKC